MAGRSPPQAFSEAFLARRPGGGSAPAEWERALAAAWERAQTAWPEIPLAPEDFGRYLAERVGGADASQALGALEIEDLYLACGCCAGRREAVAAFDRAHLSQIPQFVASFDRGQPFADEVRQRVSAKLLAGEGGESPKIREYTGRGALGGWVRITATRTALNLLRATGDRADSPLEEGLAGSADPELELIKSQAGAEVAGALRRAIPELSADARTLLKLHYVDGLSIDQIAPMFQAHRATVARWIAKAREHLLSATRQALAARLRCTAREVDSLVGLARSQLEISLRQLLRSDGART
jgi:RNA polymerase sigma-70 factor (ECF subfamily)